jgi:myo-inositol 2-dehydrogenase/D-chiro-inositol 1-dehydrogenase
MNGGNHSPKAASKLQVGVVGLGRMGRRHAFNVLHRVPQAALLCACSPAEPDLVWAQEFLVPHGVHVTSTFEQMIETPGLDAVIIASATFLHASQTALALDRGIHVLCEKPVCKTVKEVSIPFMPFLPCCPNDNITRKRERTLKVKLWTLR